MYRTRETSSTSESFEVSNSFTEGPQFLNLGASIRPTEDLRTIGPFTRSYSKMYDEGHGFGHYNDCIHYNYSINTELEESNGVFVSCFRQNAVPEFELAFQGSFRTLGPHSHLQFPSASLFNHNTLSVEFEDWEVPSSLSGEAVTAMWPQVKAELSVINSLLELKDFKHLPKLVKQTKASLNSFMSQFELLRSLLRQKRYRNLSLKQLVAVATGQHLNYMFAVRPLVSDLRAVLRAISSADKQIDNLLKRADQIHTSHWKRSLPDELIVGLDDLPNGPWSGTQNWYCNKSLTRLVSGVEYTATMRYNYHLPRWVREHAQVLGRLDAFGVNFNPAIIWNAIPFSFVVDWVANVGKTIDSYKGNLLSPIVNIEGFCHSVKYTLRDEIWISPYQAHRLAGQATYQWSGTDTLFESRDRDVFVRRNTIPDLFTSVQMTGLSTTEITLAASLLGSLWSGTR